MIKRLPSSHLPRVLQNYLEYVNRKAILIQVLTVSKLEMPYEDEWVIGGCKLLNLLKTEEAYRYYFVLYERLLEKQALLHFHEMNGSKCFIRQIIIKSNKDQAMSQNDYFNNKLDRSSLLRNLKSYSAEERAMCESPVPI